MASPNDESSKVDVTKTSKKRLLFGLLLVVTAPTTLFRIDPNEAKSICVAIGLLAGGFGLIFELRARAAARSTALSTEVRIETLEKKFENLFAERSVAVKQPVPLAAKDTTGPSDQELNAAGMTRAEFDEYAHHLSKGEDAFSKGKIAFVSKRYREAAVLFDQAAANSTSRNPSDSGLNGLQARRAAVAWASGGLAYKAMGDLDEAIRRFRDALKFLDPEKQKFERADVLGMLASTLLERAQRGKDDNRGVVDGNLSPVEREAARVASIQEALTAAKEARSVFNSTANLKDWAWVTNSIGTGYSQLSEATGNVESEKHLQLALIEYKQCLAVLTKIVAPELWAGVKGNYASALQRMAELKTPDEARALLSSSIDQITAANEVISKSAYPETWGYNQQKLATAYRDLALLEDDPSPSRSSAIRSYKDALSVMTMDGDPRRWATAQQDLSILLHEHAMLNQNSSQSLLTEALTANELAASVFTRSRNVERWARNRYQCSQIKQSLALYSGDEAARALMREAQAANREVLDVLTKVDYPVLWGTTKIALASLLIFEANRDRDLEKANTALAALNDAGSVLTADTAPLEFCQLRFWTGAGLNVLSSISHADRAANLAQSIRAHREGIACLMQRKLPNSSALLQMLSMGLRDSEQKLRTLSK